MGPDITSENAKCANTDFHTYRCWFVCETSPLLFTSCCLWWLLWFYLYIFDLHGKSDYDTKTSRCLLVSMCVWETERDLTLIMNELELCVAWYHDLHPSVSPTDPDRVCLCWVFGCVESEDFCCYLFIACSRSSSNVFTLTFLSRPFPNKT